MDVKNPGKPLTENAGKRRSMSPARLYKAIIESSKRLELGDDGTIGDLLEALQDEGFKELIK